MSQADERTVPGGWELVLDHTSYDSAMEREYTALAYRSTDRTMVRIAEVQEPKSFGGWGYLAWVQGVDGEELGLVDTLEEAKEIAYSFMDDHPPTVDGA